jgi:hypothetical protein
VFDIGDGLLAVADEFLEFPSNGISHSFTRKEKPRAAISD